MSYFYVFILVIFFSIFLLKVDLSVLSSLQNLVTTDGYIPSIWEKIDRRMSLKKFANPTDGVPPTHDGDASSKNLRIYSGIVLAQLAHFLTGGAIHYLFIVLHYSLKDDSTSSAWMNKTTFPLFTGFYFQDFAYDPKLLIVLPVLAVFAYFLGALTDKFSSRGSVFLCGGIITTVWFLFQGMSHLQSTPNFRPYRSLFSGVLSLSIIPMIKGVYSTLNNIPGYLIFALHMTMMFGGIASAEFMDLVSYLCPNKLYISGAFSMFDFVYMPITLIVLTIFALTLPAPFNFPEDEKLNFIYKQGFSPKDIFSKQFTLGILAYGLSLTQSQLFYEFMTKNSVEGHEMCLPVVVGLLSFVMLILCVLYSFVNMKWKTCLSLTLFISGFSYALAAFTLPVYVIIISTVVVALSFIGSITAFLTIILANVDSGYLGRILALSVGSAYLIGLAACRIVSQMGLDQYMLQINLGITLTLSAIISLYDKSKITGIEDELQTYILEGGETYHLPEKCENSEKDKVLETHNLPGNCYI